MMYLCFMASKETVTISRAEYQKFLDLEARVSDLTFQIAQMRRLIYGSKRERFISQDNPSQISLFELPEAEPEEAPEEQITYKRKKAADKKQPLRGELPAHLPRKEEIIEPDNLPSGAKRIGEAVTEILEYEPATLYVRRIVRPKYIM